MSAQIHFLPAVRIERPTDGEAMLSIRVTASAPIIHELERIADRANMPADDLAEALIVKGLAEINGVDVVTLLERLKVKMI